MAGETRDLYPWEARVGCSKCKARPGVRCVTTRPLHMPPWSARELRYVGSPTTAHKARYQLWCYLWGRDTCTHRRRAVARAGGVMTKAEIVYQREGVTVLRLVSCPVCHGAREVGLPLIPCPACCCPCGQVAVAPWALCPEHEDEVDIEYDTRHRRAEP